MSRGMFLHPPSPEIIREWNEIPLIPISHDYIEEAQISSWIEGEYDVISIRRAYRLSTIIASCSTLLDSHSILMKGKTSKYPGQWRPYNVTVGNYLAPDWTLVPSLMDEFDCFLKDDSIPSLLKAVWGHIQFETIHPFADGNGRIGRLLVNQLIYRPWSLAIVKDLQTYYDLLGKGDWDSWKSWMIAGLRVCPSMEQDEIKYLTS